MRSLVFCCALILSGCGPDLGDHRLVSTRYANELPASVSHSRNDPGYVVLSFRADANLNSEDINALYATATSCDDGDRRSRTVFGPFTDSVVPEGLPDHGTRAAIGDYLVYVPLKGEIWGDLMNGKTPVVGTFDLRKDDEDMCFQLEHTGYPWATRTNSVRVAASILRQVSGSPAP